MAETAAAPGRWERFKRSSFLYSFRRDRIAMASFAVICVYLLASFSAPLIAPHDPYDPVSIDIMDSEIPPLWLEEGDARFLLGTDAQGRDLLSTILYGTRISLMIGICAVLLQAVLGRSIFFMLTGFLDAQFLSFLYHVLPARLVMFEAGLARGQSGLQFAGMAVCQVIGILHAAVHAEGTKG